MALRRDQELLRAVLAAPDDDEPRLAYADLLRAAGDPLGEFVALQVEVATRRREHAPPHTWLATAQRADELEARFGKTWDRLVAGLVEDRRFRRGFVDEVRLEARHFLTCAAELYRRAPVRHLVLTHVRPLLGEVLRSPHLDRIVSLQLTACGLGDDGVRMIAESERLRRLVWLDVSANEVGLEGLEALCASRNLPRLRFLGFHGNLIPDPTASPGGVDHADGTVHAMDVPPLGRELAARYDNPRWLGVYVPNLLYFPPDKDDLTY